MGADFDSDGDLDFLQASNGFRYLEQVQPGDANGDGVFDSRDLVLIFASGFYEDEEAVGVTKAQGDFNGDGKFTSADLVFAFQTSTYVRN